MGQPRVVWGDGAAIYYPQFASKGDSISLQGDEGKTCVVSLVRDEWGNNLVFINNMSFILKQTNKAELTKVEEEILK